MRLLIPDEIYAAKDLVRPYILPSKKKTYGIARYRDDPPKLSPDAPEEVKEAYDKIIAFYLEVLSHCAVGEYY